MFDQFLNYFMRFSSLGILFGATLVLVGCVQKKEACVFSPNLDEQKMEIQIESLHDSIVLLDSKDRLVDFLTRHPIIRDQFFARRSYPDDSLFINTLFNRFSHPAFDTLFLETKRIFGDLSDLKQQFQKAFAHIQYYYPEFHPPKIKTVISGLETDLFVSDSLIVIGLDYYLGKEGKYRPKLYDYLLTRYEPEDIVPSTMLIYGIGTYNKTNLKDQTVLADMIAYGKSFYFAKHMLPCVPDSTFLWYSQAEIQGARAHQDLIWARFVEDQILFETNHVVKRKYLGERPKTLEVGEKCPGRIAQWVGWEIVKKYMEEHPQTTLKELMQMADAKEIFEQSKYRPIQ